MILFQRIKHSEGAGKVGIELRETELIILGNPKVGNSLMKCQQSVAVDLPQKALIWKDEINRMRKSQDQNNAKIRGITGYANIPA